MRSARFLRLRLLRRLCAVPASAASSTGAAAHMTSLWPGEQTRWASLLKCSAIPLAGTHSCNCVRLRFAHAPLEAIGGHRTRRQRKHRHTSSRPCTNSSRPTERESARAASGAQRAACVEIYHMGCHENGALSVDDERRIGRRIASADARLSTRQLKARSRVLDRCESGLLLHGERSAIAAAVDNPLARLCGALS